MDTLAEPIDLGLTRGLVEKSGNHLSFAGTALGNGSEQSRDALAQSPELQSTMATDGPFEEGARADRLERTVSRLSNCVG